MRHPGSQAALAGGLVAAAQYVLAPLIARVLLGYAGEPGHVTAAPTWTSALWIGAAAVLGAAFATFHLLLSPDGRPRRMVGVAAASTTAYVVAAWVFYAPHLYGGWFLAMPLLAIGFSGAGALAFLLTLGAGARLRRGATLTA